MRPRLRTDRSVQLDLWRNRLAGPCADLDQREPHYPSRRENERYVFQYRDVQHFRVAADGGVLPIPIEKTALEGLQIEESYLGFSIGAEPGAVRIKTNIPTEQVKGLAKIAMFAVALQMQGRQN